jgi:hypothetical protein
MGTLVLANASQSTADSDSVAYLIGRVFGTLIFVGIVAYFIWSAHKRKADRRALHARFALPPPPFAPSASAPTLLPPPPPPSGPSESSVTK